MKKVDEQINELSMSHELSVLITTLTNFVEHFKISGGILRPTENRICKLGPTVGEECYNASTPEFYDFS